MEEFTIRKLFFSYGHDQNAVVVNQLAEDLMDRGYEVFIDKHSIKEGNHWRREITEAILKSDMTMAFASRYSIRSPGVCLDELNIAANVRAARIQSILLEKGVVPLSNLGELQFIDMSDWQDHYSEEKGFDQEWYEDCLDRILRVLNDPKNIQYAEEMTFLKDTLRPNEKDTVRESMAMPRFYGREWLKEKVRDWIANPQKGRILMIDGAPGVGKSAFVMHLFFSFEEAVTAIYCKSNSDLDSPEEIVKLLIIKMCSKLPDYRTFVVRRLKEDIGSLRSLNSMMHVLFIDPLSMVIDGDRMNHYILIDGIDELDEFDDRGVRHNRLVDALKDKSLDDIRDYFRFIITSRPEPAIINRFQESTQIHIDSLSKENFDDIREYIEAELKEQLDSLSEEQREYVVGEILKNSEGILLYCSLLIKEIRNNNRSITDMKLPRGLYNLYLEEFDKVFSKIPVSVYDEIYAPAISILAARKARIPEETLKRACGWSRRAELQFYENFGEYLIRSDGTVRLFHKSLTDWLLSDCAGSLYGLDDDDIQKASQKLLRGCYESMKKSVSGMNEYELLNMIPLAEELSDSAEDDPQLKTMIQNILSNEALLELICEKAESCVMHNEFSNASDYLKVIELFCRMIEEYQIQKHQVFCKAKVIGEYVRGRILDSKDDLKKSNAAYETGLKYIDEYALNNSDFYPMLFAYAFSFYRLSRYPEAIRIYERIIHGDPSRKLEILEAKIGCSRCYRVNYDTRASSERLQHAMQILESIENDPDQFNVLKTSIRLFFKFLLHKAWTLDNLDWCTDSMKTISDAEELLITERDDNPDLAVELGDIAMLYYVKSRQEMNKKEYGKAVSDVEKAIETFSSIYGSTSLRVTDFIDLRGKIKEAMGDDNGDEDCYTDAESFFSKSFRIKEKAYPDENHASLMHSIDNLIRIRMKLKRSKEEILPLIEKNIRVNQKRYGIDETRRNEKEKELDELKSQVLNMH